jgi:uncharacterized protein (TIGR02186 family)
VKRWLLAALAAPLLMAQTASKPVLVPDVSQRDIEIRYSFTGADLLLFGAILYPGGRLPDDTKPTDIVVVVKGPTQSILVREKAKLGGVMWVNAARLRYRSAPSYYAIASSRPIEQLMNARTRAIYELGLGSLQLSPASSAPPSEQERFARGLVDLKGRSALYVESPGAVEITDGVLYRARVAIPARVPVGRFTAGGGDARHRDSQIGVRALRGILGGALVDRLWAGRGGAVGAVRMGGGVDRAAVLAATCAF